VNKTQEFSSSCCLSSQNLNSTSHYNCSHSYFVEICRYFDKFCSAFAVCCYIELVVVVVFVVVVYATISFSDYLALDASLPFQYQQQHQQ